MANSKGSVLSSGGNAAGAGISAVAAAACVVLLFALSACFSPYQENYGTFNINFGSSGGRSVTAWWDGTLNPDALVYSVLLDGQGETIQRENINFGEKVNFSVTPGTWDIDIKAYQPYAQEEDSVLKAVGKRTVKINPGKNGTVVVEVGPPPEETPTIIAPVFSIDIKQITDASDEITFSETCPITISRLENSELPSTATIELVGAVSFTYIFWYIDGDEAAAEEDGSIILNAWNYSDGEHHLTLEVFYEGAWYSKRITFTVE